MTDTLSTVTSDDGFSVSSTHETTEQLTESLKPEPVKADSDEHGGEAVKEADDDLSEAAAKLGKKGGETTAAKRATDAKEQPEAGKADEAPAATEDKKKGNPRHDPTARVTEATREAKAAREELARERAEKLRLADELAAERAGKVAPKDEPKPAKIERDPKAPKLDDFGTFEEWVEATADYKAEQRLSQHLAHQQQREVFAARGMAIDNAVKSYTERIAEAKKADATFLDKTAPILNRLQPSFLKDPSAPLEATHVIADELIKSPQSAALLTYFADNEAELQRLESLSSIPDIQAEIRFLAKGLTAAPLPSASKPEISKARPPVRPVTGAPHAAGEPDPDSSSFDEHVVFHNSREGVRR